MHADKCATPTNSITMEKNVNRNINFDFSIYILYDSYLFVWKLILGSLSFPKNIWEPYLHITMIDLFPVLI